MLASIQVMVTVVLVATGLPAGAQNRIGGINTGTEAVTRVSAPASPDIAWEIYGGGREVAVDALLAAKGTGVQIPNKATDVLSHVRQHGNAPPGVQGGRTFSNDGRGGGQVLPRADANGNPVSYREWDVNPYQRGVNRGPERLVTGSDGKAYYTTDHYMTFTVVP